MTTAIARGSGRPANATGPAPSSAMVGRLRVGPEARTVELEPGDLVTFAADVPHVYEALETTHCVLLMAYP
jgi:quercetin dioxygenase-like cupin family protein